MGLIKKPDKKRHRVQKDPYAIALKKAGKKQIRRNRRLGADDQEVSRADRVVMQFKMSKLVQKAAVDGEGRNKKKRKNKLLDSSKFAEAVEPFQPGMNKPLKPVPVHRQRPGENDKQFMERVRKTTLHILDQSRFEDKYDVDVWQDPTTGKVDLKSRKGNTTYKNDVEAELAEMKRLAEADPSIKKHVKFGVEVKVADPVKKAEAEAEKEREGGKPLKKSRKVIKRDAPARKVVKERNRCKLLKARKKLKRLKGDGMEKLDEDSCPVTDEVQFGEVVSAPPLLEHKPRKAEGKKTNRPGRKDLLLKKFLPTSEYGKAVKTPTKSPTPKGGQDFAKAMRKRELEAERERVMAAYKAQKRRKVPVPSDADDD